MEGHAMIRRALFFFLGIGHFLVAQEPITVEWIYGDEAARLTGTPYHFWTSSSQLIVFDASSDSRWVVLDPRSDKRTRWLDENQSLKSLEGLVSNANRPVSLPWPSEISGDGRLALYEFESDLFLLNSSTSTFSRLTDTQEEEVAARFSPDGSKVSFVRKNNLFVYDLASGRETQLTYDGGETVLNGTLTWLYWEEIFDRVDLGYWWSPDSKSIAYLQSDETGVSVVRWTDFKPAIPREILQRYPKTGGVNPLVRVGVVGADGGSTKWLGLEKYPYEYIGRVRWLPDSRRVSVQTLNREQTKSDVLVVTLSSGECQKIMTENDPGWINFHDDMIFLGKNDSFLWLSERTGYGHIYKGDLNGRLSPITAGEWTVRPSGGKGSICHVDEKEGYVYFTALEKSSTERHLYRIRMDGKRMERLTTQVGTHKIFFSPDGQFYLDEFSSSSSLPELILCKQDGRRAASVSPDRSQVLKKMNIQFPELFSIPAQDGFMMPAQIMKPSDFDPSKKYPLIVYVYGGPGAPVVANQWNRDQWYNQLLVENGFLVAKVDNRSATAISKTLENTVARLQASDVELNDLVDAVKWLKLQPYVDSERIGVWGWSGGGTFTLLALSRSKEFKAGISVAPVTDWHYYDTKYGEASMKTPEANPAGYAKTSLPQYAKDLHGRLLLVFGTYDDNVHPQNSFHFIDELVKSNIPFDLMIYPMRKHGISDRPARIHLYTKMIEFWKEHLAN